MIWMLLVLAAQAGGWEIVSIQDAMSDLVTPEAHIETDTGTVGFFCPPDDEPAAFVQPRQFIGGPIRRYELRNTWVRFDDEPPVKQDWKYIDRLATPYSRRETTAFISRLTTASRLRIRLTRYDNIFVDLDFDLTRDRQSAAELASRCIN